MSHLLSPRTPGGGKDLLQLIPHLYLFPYWEISYISFDPGIQADSD